MQVYQEIHQTYQACKGEVKMSYMTTSYVLDNQNFNEHAHYFKIIYPYVDTYFPIHNVMCIPMKSHYSILDI